MGTEEIDIYSLADLLMLMTCYFMFMAIFFLWPIDVEDTCLPFMFMTCLFLLMACLFMFMTCEASLFMACLLAC